MQAEGCENIAAPKGLGRADPRVRHPKHESTGILGPSPVQQILNREQACDGKRRRKEGLELIDPEARELRGRAAPSESPGQRSEINAGRGCFVC